MTDATNGSGQVGGMRIPADMAARQEAAIASTAALREEYPHEIGIKYGSAERNTVDIYLPKGDPLGPTIVFIHGGGFRGGNAGSVGDHGRPYVEAGGIFVSMGYRLVPEARFPECAGDIEDGLNFLVTEIARRGGDPGQIYLSGHSAGAMLTAQVGFHPSPKIDRELVRGLVLISGIYDFVPQADETIDRSHPAYVPDLCVGIDRVPPHAITVNGDDDWPAPKADGPRMTEAIRAAGGSVEYFLEPNADHFDANRSFITPGGVVAEATKAMMGLPAGVLDPAGSKRS